MTFKHYLIIFSAIFIVTTGQAAAQFKMNIEVVDHLCDEVSGQIAKLPGDSVQINLNFSQLNPEIAGYLYLRLGNNLSEQGLKVFRNFNSDQTFDGIVLELNKAEVKIDYAEIAELNILKQATVQRIITFTCTGQLFSAIDGRIISPISHSKTYSDSLETDLINQAEQSAYSFTKGERIAGSGWLKYYEPILLSGAVSVVLYLFFSLRS